MFDHYNDDNDQHYNANDDAKFFKGPMFPTSSFIQPGDDLQQGGVGDKNDQPVGFVSSPFDNFPECHSHLVIIIRFFKLVKIISQLDLLVVIGH